MCGYQSPCELLLKKALMASRSSLASKYLLILKFINWNLTHVDCSISILNQKKLKKSFFRACNI